MATKPDLDELDKKILSEMSRDARVSFLGLSKKFNVASGTIHLRVEKLKELGILKGSKAVIDPKALGYDICCFIGIILKDAKSYSILLKNLEMFREVVEVYYTTGSYACFVKVMTPTIDELHNFLSQKLQGLKEIHSTETFISLDNPINREINPR